MKTSNFSIKKLSDEEVISRFKESGNAAVLGILFDRYSKLVYGLCLKYLKNPTAAEDETMSIFEKLINHLSNQNIECFKAWLYIFSKNHCLMELRRKKPHLVELNTNTHSESIHLQNEKEIIDKELQNEKKIHLVHSLIKFLKPAQQKCLELFYINNLSYREVSCSTGLSIKQVKSNIQNGKRNLKIHFEKHMHYDHENPEQ